MVMMTVGMVAMGLLQRRQRLLSAREIAVLQRLPDLAQSLRKRIIGIPRRPLTAVLEGVQCRVGLLRVCEVPGIESARQLAEILTKLRLRARRLKAALCWKDCRDRHDMSPSIRLAADPLRPSRCMREFY